MLEPYTPIRELWFWVYVAQTLLWTVLQVYTEMRNPEGHSPKYGNRHMEAKTKTVPLTTPSLPVSKATLWREVWLWPVVGAIVSIVLGGGISVMSSHPFVADAFFLIGIMLLLVKFVSWPDAHGHKSSAFVIGLLFGLAVVAGNHKLNNAYPFGPVVKVPIASNDRPPETLEDTFRRDFPYVLKSTFGGISFRLKNGTSMPIERNVYADFQGNTKFVGFYIPSAGLENDYDYAACLAVASEVQRAMDDLEKEHSVAGGVPGQMTNLRSLRFSGRVMLYTGDDLSITQQADIIKAYKQKGYDVTFVGPDHLADARVQWYRQHSDR